MADFVSHPPPLHLRAALVASKPTSIKGFARFYQIGSPPENGNPGLILISDFDPSGEWIASLARSMRDDFGLDVHPVKAALTLQQVQTLPGLPESIGVKSEGGHYKAWLKKYGPKQRAFELEAVPPPVLQPIVRSTIESTLDHARFNRERARQKKEGVQLVALRKVVRETLGKFNS
jgi:hypothetical protein